MSQQAVDSPLPGFRKDGYTMMPRKTAHVQSTGLAWKEPPTLDVEGKLYLSPTMYRLPAKAHGTSPAQTVIATAPMGAGKTKSLLSFLETLDANVTVLVIVPSRALADSIRDGYPGFHSYLETPRDQWTPILSPKFVVCVPSLPKISGRYDVVIADEVCSILSIALASIVSDHASVLESLERHMFPLPESHRRAFYLDAMFSDETLAWLGEKIQDKGNMVAFRYHTPLRQLPFTKVLMYPDLNSVLRGFVECVHRKEKVVLVTNCATMFRYLSVLLHSNDESLRAHCDFDIDTSTMNIALFTANEASACHELIEKGPVEDDQEGYGKIFTPVLGAGCSFTWPIDRVFGVFNTKSGQPAQAVQMLGRFRNVNSKTAYVTVLPGGEPPSTTFEQFVTMAIHNREADAIRYFRGLFPPGVSAEDSGPESIVPFLDKTAPIAKRAKTLVDSFKGAIENHRSVFERAWNARALPYDLAPALKTNSSMIELYCVSRMDDTKPPVLRKRTLAQFIRDATDLSSPDPKRHAAECRGSNPLTSQAVENHVFGSGRAEAPSEAPVPASVIRFISDIAFECIPRAVELTTIYNLLCAMSTVTGMTSTTAPLNAMPPVEFYVQFFEILAWPCSAEGICLREGKFEISDLTLIGQWERLYLLFSGELGRHAREWTCLPAASAIGNVIKQQLLPSKKKPTAGEQLKSMRSLVHGFVSHIGIRLEEASCTRPRADALPAMVSLYGPCQADGLGRLRIYTFDDSRFHCTWLSLVSRAIHTHARMVRSHCANHVLYPPGISDLFIDGQERQDRFRDLMEVWDNTLNKPCGFVSEPENPKADQEEVKKWSHEAVSLECLVGPA